MLTRGVCLGMAGIGFVYHYRHVPVYRASFRLEGVPSRPAQEDTLSRDRVELHVTRRGVAFILPMVAVKLRASLNEIPVPVNGVGWKHRVIDGNDEVS